MTRTLRWPPTGPAVVGAHPEQPPHRTTGATDPDASDIVEVWGQDSFPASDPPANW